MKKGSTNNFSFNQSNNYFQDNDFDLNQMDLQNSLDSCALINKYIDLNNQALSLLEDNRFSEALNYFESASSTAEDLRDYFKKYESECNKGITYFHLNNINTAVSLFQPSFNYFSKICNEGSPNNDIKNLTLFCKSGGNLCMCKILFFNDNDDCTNLIKDIINIISQEEDLNTQQFCIKYLNNILFNESTLLSINNNSLSNYLKYSIRDVNQLNSSEERQEEIDKINKVFKESFYNFIATQEVDPWINTLNIIYEKANELNYSSGKLNILFNQQLAICLKYMENKEENNPNSKKAKLKLLALIQSKTQNNYNNEFKEINNNDIEIGSEGNEEDINNIINDYKNKLINIRKIYEILYSFENQINQNFSMKQKKGQSSNIINMDYYNKNIMNNNYNDKYEEDLNFNLDSEYYLQLLLRYTKSYFEKNIEDQNLKDQLINKIEISLNAINNPQNSGLDFSSINLSCLDPEISNHLCNIFRRLFYIYRRSILKKYFDKFKNLTKKDSIKKLKSSKKKKPIQKMDNLEHFFERRYRYIYDGEKLDKINFRNNRTKMHYFQVEYKTDKFQYYEGNITNKPKKGFDFDDILKIKVGIETQNVITKLNKIKICSANKNMPYLFMSFILSNDEQEKSLDLIFNNEESAKNWFYGLYYYLQISKRPYKICSCTNYILFRIKNKILNELNIEIDKKKKRPLARYIIKYFKKFRDNQNSDDLTDNNIF